MDRIKSIFVVLAVAVLSVACDKDKPVVKYLDVTPNNLAGEWKLVEWGDAPLQDGTYFYIDFIRKDREFIMYQNFDSMGDMPHKVTGTYNIEYDLEKGAIIRGMYDYSEGYWSHSYQVDKLTETSMVWTATDGTGFVQKFVRCDIPENIK